MRDMEELFPTLLIPIVWKPLRAKVADPFKKPHHSSCWLTTSGFLTPRTDFNTLF